MITDFLVDFFSIHYSLLLVSSGVLGGVWISTACSNCEIWGVGNAYNTADIYSVTMFEVCGVSTDWISDSSCQAAPVEVDVEP